MNPSVLDKSRINYLWKTALPGGINDLQPLQVLQQEKLNDKGNIQYYRKQTANQHVIDPLFLSRSFSVLKNDLMLNLHRKSGLI